MSAAAGIAAGFLLMVVMAMLQAEAVGRLERLPLLLLRLAARRLPRNTRAAQLEEWSANLLDEVYAATPGLPITRLFRGLAFSTSAWWGARKLARAIDPTLPSSPWTSLQRLCYRGGVVAGAWSVRRGHRRFVSHFVSYLVALAFVNVLFLFLLPSLMLSGGGGYKRAVLVTVGVMALQSVVLAFGRACAVTVVECGRRRGWPQRRIYLAYESLVDTTVPTVSISMALMTGGRMSWGVAAFWVAAAGGFMAINWQTSRHPDRMHVEIGLLRSR